jgi:hypothetical protein
VSELAPGQRGLQYGEPATFSSAFSFDIPEEETKNIQKLRIIITDYLGHEYKREVEAISFIKKAIPFLKDGQECILLQDNTPSRVTR